MASEFNRKMSYARKPLTAIRNVAALDYDVAKIFIN
jgi:hypothetical protein